MLDAKNIFQEAQALEPEASRLYRHLHRFPETANQEIKTSQFIREELTRQGVSFLAPTPTITIAVIEGKGPGATVGLRCDIDALPVQEETGLPFASEIPGAMHACGHDGHAAIGLCTAALLARHKEEWPGRVKIIFQPAEEMGGGAEQVIATGLTEDVDVFFAIHLWSPYATGTLHVSPIVVSAAVDSFRILVQGQGGHGATPEKCRDALLAASQLVVSLQSIVSRRVAPMEPAVVTVGSFHAGNAGNIIAETAELRGTVRSTGKETRSLILNAMEDMALHISAAYGCTATMELLNTHPEVRNDPRAASLARECAESLLGRAPDAQRTMMLGDDFSCYGEKKPLCYVQVGIADEQKQTTAAHHNSKFKIDEDVLPLSIAWMTLFSLRAAREWLTPSEG